MKKILFLIRDLGHGGAEKVLVNLVNHLDKTKFDITVMTLFDEGINKQYLSPDIRYKTCFKKSFPANSHILKLFTPSQLHKKFIKETYDIEVAYLEGPASRVISGCENKTTKLAAWIHSTANTEIDAFIGFRSLQEAIECYHKFNTVVFVSKSVKTAFLNYIPIKNSKVLFNINDSHNIKKLSEEHIDIAINKYEINIISVGRIIDIKGFKRLAKIHCKLRKEGYFLHTYILGEGDNRHKQQIADYVSNEGESSTFTFLGYKKNPYKYVAKCDLFVCSSYSEGFSTAATEALIVGTPVCTVDVSGMREMLGENNEYGIVTENNEQALYEGIKDLLDNPEKLAYYKRQAEKRGKDFSTEKTVQTVENLLLNLDGVNL